LIDTKILAAHNLHVPTSQPEDEYLLKSYNGLLKEVLDTTDGPLKDAKITTWIDEEIAKELKRPGVLQEIRYIIGEYSEQIKKYSGVEEEINNSHPDNVLKWKEEIVGNKEGKYDVNATGHGDPPAPVLPLPAPAHPDGLRYGAWYGVANRMERQDPRDALKSKDDDNDGACRRYIKKELETIVNKNRPNSFKRGLSRLWKIAFVKNCFF